LDLSPFSQAGVQHERETDGAAQLAAAELQERRGRVVNLLYAGRVQRPRARVTGEQPVARAILAPVFAQLLEQPRRQQRVAILAPLALIDANQHPLGMNVLRLEMHQFRHAQPRGIARHQEHAMLAVRSGLDQPRDLAATQRLRQPARSFCRHPQIEIASAQHLLKKDPNAGQLLVARAEGELPVGDEDVQEVANLLQRDAIGGSAEVLSQLHDGRDVGLDRSGTLAVQFEFADHLLT